jgi:hypothetical protein
MNTAEKGMQMNGYIAGPFQVVLGTHRFSVNIYVAPIEGEILLGLDADPLTTEGPLRVAPPSFCRLSTRRPDPQLSLSSNQAPSPG